MTSYLRLARTFLVQIAILMTNPEETEVVNEEVRLQKALAAAGVASRRACEELIVKGQVKVNGAIKTWKRDPSRFEIPVKYGLYQCARFDQDEALRRFVVKV